MVESAGVRNPLAWGRCADPHRSGLAADIAGDPNMARHTDRPGALEATSTRLLWRPRKCATGSRIISNIRAVHVGTYPLKPPIANTHPMQLSRRNGSSCWYSGAPEPGRSATPVRRINSDGVLTAAAMALPTARRWRADVLRSELGRDNSAALRVGGVILLPAGSGQTFVLRSDPARCSKVVSRLSLEIAAKAFAVQTAESQMARRLRTGSASNTCHAREGSGIQPADKPTGSRSIPV